jgi:hypothetical protein
MHTVNNTHETVILVSLLSIVSFVLACLLVASYKTGKIIKGKVRFGEPIFYERKIDPFGYWLIFIQLSLVCAFIMGCAIWVFIHGT